MTEQFACLPKRMSWSAAPDDVITPACSDYKYLYSAELHNNGCWIIVSTHSHKMAQLPQEIHKTVKLPRISRQEKKKKRPKQNQTRSVCEKRTVFSTNKQIFHLKASDSISLRSWNETDDCIACRRSQNTALASLKNAGFILIYYIYICVAS